MPIQQRKPTPRSSGTRRSRSRAGGGPPPRTVYGYGLIGNLHSAALVSDEGAIDWACFPRFASPSVFARILDSKRGGVQWWAPRSFRRTHQEYLPSTAILQTVFQVTESTSVTLLDFMPILPRHDAHDYPMIVRVAEASGGAVPVRAVVDPRFQYASLLPKWSTFDGRWTARAGSFNLTVETGWPMQARGTQLSGRVLLRPGERHTLEIYWGRTRPTRDGPLELLEATERFWTEWVHPPSSTIHLLAGRWHPAIERSEITLKLLSQRETGAFIAAPTTSLPEWPGGSRNWDYRYVWVRDAAFAAQSLLLMGHLKEARAFLHWILERVTLRARGPRLRVVYGAHGEIRFHERELDYLRGFAHSRPVRVGNAAANQFQLDIYGELLDAALLLRDIEPDALEKSWAAIESIAEEVVRKWRTPDRGIWEVRGPPQHFVHSKVMAWVALDRAVRLGTEWTSRDVVLRWERERDRIRAITLARGFDTHRESFVQSFTSRVDDASNLRIPIVGFLEPDDPRVAGTVLRIARDLTDGPFVYRYTEPDGIEGPEGCFLPCAFWLVDALARAGEQRRARDNFVELLRRASPHGLFSEEYDPRSNRPLGNYPQAFTHIALVRAAMALGLATAPRSVLEEYPWLTHATWRREGPPAPAIPLPGAKRRVGLGLSTRGRSFGE